MKAKITSGKIRFLMLCLTVLFSVMGISFSAAAEEVCTHPNLTENGWTIVQKTNCQGAGSKTQWCYDCGSLVEEKLPFDSATAPHVKGKWVTVTPNSCQSEGERVIYCYFGCKYKEDCEEGKAGDLIVLEREKIPAHNYSVIFREAPTCTKEGYEFVACLDCYDMKSFALTVDKDNHDYTPFYTVKEPTCKEEGVKERKCLYCGHKDSEVIPVVDGHKNIVWNESAKVPATCDKSGYIPGVCEDCKKELKKEVPQHTDSGYRVISLTESTCTTNGIERRSCNCGLEYDVELPLKEENHVYSDWIVTKQPSCTDGSRYKYCRYHDDARIVQSIPSNGEHNYGEWTVVTEPDCSKKGLEQKTCIDCKKVISRELPTKHDYGTWTVLAEMSCDEKEPIKGAKLAKCDNCNYEKYFSIPSVHSFSAWRILEKADCKDNKPGKMERTCLGCKKVETKEYYAEHDFTDWFVTGKPVCAEKGITGRTGTYTRWCNSCGKTEHKEIGVNHEFVEVEIIKYPECFENGSTETGLKLVKCKFCDVTDKQTISAEHNFGEWKVITDSTCSATGVKEHSCIACGYTESAAIPTHSFGNWMYNREKVVCGTSFGDNTYVTLKKYCAKCGVESAETKTVNKIEHPNTITIVTEATCITSGYTSEICLDCGAETIVGDITPAKGHTLDAYWTAKKQATCNSAGSRYKACADCDYIEYQEVAKTQHTLIELKPGLEPTCTAGGYTSETMCVVCKEIFPSETVAPLDHDIPEGSEICTRCKAYKDTDCTCACHSTSGMEALFFKLINKLYQMFGINQQCGCGVLHYDEPGFFAKLFGKA